MLCEWLTPATCLSVARADINTNFVLSGPEPNDTALCRSPRQHKIDHTYTGVTPNEDAGMGSIAISISLLRREASVGFLN